MIFGSMSNGWQLLVILAILLVITLRKFFKTWAEYRKDRKQREDDNKEERVFVMQQQKIMYGNNGHRIRKSTAHVNKKQQTVMKQ